MALNASRVSTPQTPGVAAAATARSASGGRNVAHSSQSPVEASNFSTELGVKDGNLYRFEEEGAFDFLNQQKHKKHGTPFVFHTASAFSVDEILESMGEDGFGTYLSEIIHGIGVYEQNMQIILPGAVRAGTVMNYLF